MLHIIYRAERRYIEVTREELGPDEKIERPPEEKPPRKVYPSLAGEDSVAEVRVL